MTEEEKDRLLRFAYIYFRKGRLGEASSYCQQILSQYPQDLEALELMGDIENARGKWGNACSYYEKVLQLNPTNKNVEAKLERTKRDEEQFEKILRDEGEQHTGDISVRGRTSLRLKENIEAFLCYLLPLWFPFLVLVLEKESKFARFHAIQSLLLEGAFYIIGRLVGVMGIVIGGGALVNYILYIPLGLLSFIHLWLMWRALKGEAYKLPWIGDLAEKWAGI